MLLFWTNKTINFYFSGAIQIPFVKEKTVKILSTGVESFAIDVVFWVMFDTLIVESKESKKLQP